MAPALGTLVRRAARDEVGGWLKSHGVRFFPVVNWAERGVYGDGNSVPRFHLTWGCGQALVDAMWDSIQRHPRRSQLEVRFGTRVTELLQEDGAVCGCRVVHEEVNRIGGSVTHISRMWNLRRCCSSSAAEASAAWVEADTAAVGACARPHRPPIWPGFADPNL
jgi:predicted oxidoreductase